MSAASDCFMILCSQGKSQEADTGWIDSVQKLARYVKVKINYSVKFIYVDEGQR